MGKPAATEGFTARQVLGLEWLEVNKPAARRSGSAFMNLRVFYYFEQGPQEVPSTAPLSLSSEGICESLLPWLMGGDDYIGLLDEADNLIQIMREPQSEDYWIELPQLESRLSYGQSLSGPALVDILGRLPRRFRLSEFPAFRPRPWRICP